jgi:hypothetical protein
LPLARAGSANGTGPSFVIDEHPRSETEPQINIGEEIRPKMWNQMKRKLSSLVLSSALVTLSSLGTLPAHAAEHPDSKPGQRDVDWPVYTGQVEGQHYSPLTQINRANVTKLKVQWTYDTGEEGIIETNPLIVRRVLYAYTPSEKVIALDAATGKLLWKFDSGIKAEHWARGLTYWTDGKEDRIFAGVMNYLYALDPKTGKPIPSFGEDGRVDLRKNLRGDYRDHYVSMDTPGLIYKELIIVGGEMMETLPAPPGDIRAYDVRTRELRWSFHTIPHPGEFGYLVQGTPPQQHRILPERGRVVTPRRNEGGLARTLILEAQGDFEPSSLFDLKGLLPLRYGEPGKSLAAKLPVSLHPVGRPFWGGMKMASFHWDWRRTRARWVAECDPAGAVIFYFVRREGACGSL